MKRDVKLETAFIFINVEMYSGLDILEKLRKFEYVKEAYPVYGVYDFVIKIEVDSIDKIKELVTQKLRKMEAIRSTLTLIVG